MAQTGEGAYFWICAKRLEYKPPSSRYRYLLVFIHQYNTRLAIYGAYFRFEPRTQQQELALPSRGQLCDTSQTDS